MRVPSENPLLGAQIIVNALVVLVDVAANAIVLGKVTVRIGRQTRRRHWKVGQKRLGRGVDSGRIDHVRYSAESPHNWRRRTAYRGKRGLRRWRQTGFG